MIKIGTVNLEIVVGTSSAIPDTSVMELAFAGRSNVGKSSLINALMGRKNYARTSERPGKTQTINYYRINEGIRDREDFARDCYLVDLPGYGYAATAVSEKEKWGRMIERYLHTSKMLRAVFLLVDIRHKPSANDVQMFEWITQSGIEPVVIATKQDKINRSQLPKRIREIREVLHADKEVSILPFSALSKDGREEIWRTIEGL